MISKELSFFEKLQEVITFIPKNCIFVISIRKYFVSTVAASKVHKAPLNIKVKLKRLHKHKPLIISSYLWFLQNCLEEISMTVWGIESLMNCVLDFWKQY